MLAALSSCIIPEIGQVYAGDLFWGFALLLHWGLASA